MRGLHAPVGLLAVALGLAACSQGGGIPAAGGEPASVTTVDGSSGTDASTPGPSTATTATTAGGPSPSSPVPTSEAGPHHRVAAAGAFVTGPRGAAAAATPGGPVTGRLRAGVTMAIDAVEGGWARVLTPCENHLWVRMAEGDITRNADIVIDPGHGGSEAGAVGPGGLAEKELNLVVARMTVEMLGAEGVTAVLARTGDYRQSLASRVAVAAALDPKAFVSIHHNAAPDEQWPKPGTETYYQVGKDVASARSADSKRLAGLIYEEVVEALSAFRADWVADRDAGAKYRLGESGDDYYGILRRSAAGGVVASLAELAFISNPSEEALLQRDDVRRAEAGALARGVLRWLRGEQPGDVFVVPYPRSAPAGGGGGTTGCVDPA